MEWSNASDIGDSFHRASLDLRVFHPRCDSGGGSVITSSSVPTDLYWNRVRASAGTTSRRVSFPQAARSRPMSLACSPSWSPALAAKQNSRRACCPINSWGMAGWTPGLPAATLRRVFFGRVPGRCDGPIQPVRSIDQHRQHEPHQTLFDV